MNNITDSEISTLTQFVETVRTFAGDLSAYFTNLREKFLPLTEHKFEIWEDDLKANTFLYRLLDSASTGRSRIDPALLEEIRGFIGPWTPKKGEEELAAGRASWKEVLASVRKNLTTGGDTLKIAIETSEELLTVLEY
jgi:hypothetical protein